MRKLTTSAMADKQSQAALIWQDMRVNRIAVINTRDVARNDRKILVDRGLLLEIVKGWYLVCQTNDEQGHRDTWIKSYWQFCQKYLDHRFGQDWCLSANNSLLLHAKNQNPPIQTVVSARGANNRTVRLPFGHSLFCCQPALPAASDMILNRGIRMFHLTPALIHATPNFYADHPDDAKKVLEILIKQGPDAERLVQGDNLSGVGRLIGALRSIGADPIATEIRKSMTRAGHNFRVVDPFSFQFPWQPIGVWQGPD